MAGIGGFRPPFVVMIIDCSFLIAVGLMIVIEIVVGRNWRNLKVILPVLMFLGANILFHIEVLTQGDATYGRRLSIAVVIFLITLIGGRIIPSFTRNWLVKSNPGKLPVPFNRFDGVCLLGGIISLIAWAIFPDVPLVGWLLIIAAGFASLAHGTLVWVSCCQFPAFDNATCGLRLYPFRLVCIGFGCADCRASPAWHRGDWEHDDSCHDARNIRPYRPRVESRPRPDNGIYTYRVSCNHQKRHHIHKCTESFRHRNYSNPMDRWFRHNTGKNWPAVMVRKR